MKEISILVLMKSYLRRFSQTFVKVFFVLMFAGLFVTDPDGAESSSPETEKNIDFVRLFTEQEGNFYGGVIARTLSSDQSVWVTASQPGEVAVDIYRASEGYLFQALSYRSKEAVDTGSSNSSFRTAPFAVDTKKLRRLAGTQSFSIMDKNDRIQATLPIKEPGIYYVRALQGETIGDAFLVVSNIATQVKEADQKLVTWTVDTRTGRHVNEGSVEVYSLSNRYKETQSAGIGRDGVAQVAFDKDDDVLLARSGGEVTVTPLNFADHSDRWFVNDWQSFVPTQTVTRSFLFTDRPLYQPGDTILFKSILRDDHDAVYGIPHGAVRVKLYEGGYWDEKNAVFDQVIKLSDEGSLDGKFRLPATLGTGEYVLSVEAVSISKNTKRGYYSSSGRTIYGTAWIEVQYYRKPEFGIDVEMEKDRLIAGDTLRATVSGSYFSGQPLEGETLQYIVRASDYYDSSYDTADEGSSGAFENDYRFGVWYGRTISSGTVTLGADGKAIIESETLEDTQSSSVDSSGHDRQRDTMPKVYSIEVSLDGDDQHAVFENRNALVMPGDFSIRQKGFLRDSRQGEKITLPVVLRSNPGSSAHLSDREIVVETHVTRWVKDETAPEDKKKYPWQWPYHREDRDFDTMRVRTDQNGEANIDFTPPEDGSYSFTLKINDDRGNELRRTLYMWVPDQLGVYYRGSESNQSKLLTLQVDNKTYRPGESVEVSISSLVPDREVWLTFVRDHVRRYQSVFVKGNSATVRLLLEENDVPSIYLSGTVFDATSISTDQVEVNMNSESKEMHLDVRTDKDHYEPGDVVSAEVSAKDFQGRPMSGEVTLWAVDKALFELVDKDSNNIFNAFWFHRYDQTETANSLQGLTYAVDMAEGGGCFSGDTKVLMEDGSSREIRDVRVGDRVLTRKSDRDTTLVTASVLSTHEIQEDGYLLVNGSMQVTPAHKLFVNGDWNAAGDMVIGDRMTGPDGNSIPVVSLEWKREKIMVYNLTIEGAHSFFADGILAHNDIGGKAGGVRSRFVDTAYWNPRLLLGSDGKAKVTFKVPDNTTTWVLSAIGADMSTRVGQAKREIIVSKDVIVRTVLPNEMRVGDSLVMPVMVHNNTDQPLDFSVAASFSAGLIESDTDRTVSIGAHAVEKMNFKVRPERADDLATFTVQALPKPDGQTDVEGDDVVFTVPVVEYGFAQSVFQSAIGPKDFSLHWEERDDPSKRHVTIDIASDLFGTLPSAMKYLLQYPYGCVEQTTSRFVPLVIAKQYPSEFGEALKHVESSEMIAQGIKHLHELQHEDGSFGFWHEGDDNPFITGYVAEYLVAAKPFGIETDMIDSMLEKLRTYTESKSEFVKGKLGAGEKESQKGDDWWDDPHHYEGEMISLAYAKSVLGLPLDSSETHPGQKLNGYENLPPDILALAVLTNVRQGDLDTKNNGAEALLAMASQDESGALSWKAGEWTGYYSSSQASTAFAIRALTASRIDRELLARAIKPLSVNRNTSYWGNTFATAQTIRALADFHRLDSPDTVPDYTYQVLVDGKEVASGLMKGIHGQKTVELGSEYFSQSVSSIQVVREGAGDMYSTLSQGIFSVDKSFPGTSGDLTVKREYRNLREFGAPIAVGDKVEVILTATLNQSSNRSDRIVLDDTLPSGLIPVNSLFKNEQVAGDRDFGNTYYSSFSVDQYNRNGAVLTAEAMGMDSFRATYIARAVNAGEYAVLPASASLMYAPEYSGYSPADNMVITEEKLHAPMQQKEPEKKERVSTLSEIVLVGLGIIGFSAGVLVAFIAYKVMNERKREAAHIIESVDDSQK